MSEIFERAYPDEDCGCPVEEWVVNNISLMIHFEPDGTLEVFADTGDWDINVPLKATTMDAGRAEAFAWANAIPSDPQS
jgi:hypothetical protein